MYTLEGASSVANFIAAYEDSIKSKLPFSIRNAFFFFLLFPNSAFYGCFFFSRISITFSNVIESLQR